MAKRYRIEREDFRMHFYYYNEVLSFLAEKPRPDQYMVQVEQYNDQAARWENADQYPVMAGDVFLEREFQGRPVI